MIKTKIEISEEEVAALREIMMASPKNVKKRKRVRVISAIMSIVMAIYIVISFVIHAYAYLLFGFVFAIFFVWMTINGGAFLQNLVYKKAQNRMDDRLKSGLREYHFDMDGVTVSSEFGCSLNKWDVFKCWGIFKEYIYLRKIDNQMILVKKSNLLKEDYENLLSLLNTYLTEEKLLQL